MTLHGPKVLRESEIMRNSIRGLEERKKRKKLRITINSAVKIEQYLRKGNFELVMSVQKGTVSIIDLLHIFKNYKYE